MPALYLLRHGQLPPNPERRFIGQQDIPLAPAGLAQARFWHEALRDIPFTQAWCSDLLRCQTTAATVLAGRTLPVYREPALREISLGAWEGLTKAEVEQRFPHALAARGADFAGYRPQGGESFGQLQQRVLAALRRRLHDCAEGETLLVVTHFGVISVIIQRYMALPWSDLFTRRLPYAVCLPLHVTAADFA